MSRPLLPSSEGCLLRGQGEAGQRSPTARPPSPPALGLRQTPVMKAGAGPSSSHPSPPPKRPSGGVTRGLPPGQGLPGRPAWPASRQPWVPRPLRAAWLADASWAGVGGVPPALGLPE